MQNNFPKMSLFLSFMFFCVSFFVFLFFYRAISDNNKESQLKEQQWQSETLRRNGIKQLDDSVKMIEGDRAQLETHFAQSSDIVPFLDTIEGLAPKTGITAEVTSVDLSADRTELVVGMKTSGTFNGLYKFLTLLENSPYELEFIGVDMRREMGVNIGSKNIVISKWNIALKIKLLSFVP